VFVVGVVVNASGCDVDRGVAARVAVELATELVGSWGNESKLARVMDIVDSYNNRMSE
jgi:hypothetical protein